MWVHLLQQKNSNGSFNVSFASFSVLGSPKDPSGNDLDIKTGLNL